MVLSSVLGWSLSEFEERLGDFAAKLEEFRREMEARPSAAVERGLVKIISEGDVKKENRYSQLWSQRLRREMGNQILIWRTETKSWTPMSWMEAYLEITPRQSKLPQVTWADFWRLMACGAEVQVHVDTRRRDPQEEHGRGMANSKMLRNLMAHETRGRATPTYLNRCPNMRRIVRELEEQGKYLRKDDKTNRMCITTSQAEESAFKKATEKFLVEDEQGVTWEERRIGRGGQKILSPTTGRSDSTAAHGTQEGKSPVQQSEEGAIEEGEEVGKVRGLKDPLVHVANKYYGTIKTQKGQEDAERPVIGGVKYRGRMERIVCTVLNAWIDREVRENQGFDSMNTFEAMKVVQPTTDREVLGQLDIQSMYNQLPREGVLGAMRVIFNELRTWTKSLRTKYGMTKEDTHILHNLNCWEWLRDRLLSQRVTFKDRAYRTTQGVDQGDVMSPVMARGYLTYKERGLKEKLAKQGVTGIQRYVDDVGMKVQVEAITTFLPQSELAAMAKNALLTYGKEVGLNIELDISFKYLGKAYAHSGDTDIVGIDATVIKPFRLQQGAYPEALRGNVMVQRMVYEMKMYDWDFAEAVCTALPEGSMVYGKWEFPPKTFSDKLIMGQIAGAPGGIDLLRKMYTETRLDQWEKEWKETLLPKRDKKPSTEQAGGSNSNTASKAPQDESRQAFDGLLMEAINYMRHQHRKTKEERVKEKTQARRELDERAYMVRLQWTPDVSALVYKIKREPIKYRAESRKLAEEDYTRKVERCMLRIKHCEEKGWSQAAERIATEMIDMNAPTDGKEIVFSWEFKGTRVMHTAIAKIEGSRVAMIREPDPEAYETRGPDWVEETIQQVKEKVLQMSPEARKARRPSKEELAWERELRVMEVAMRDEDEYELFKDYGGTRNQYLCYTTGVLPEFVGGPKSEASLEVDEEGRLRGSLSHDEEGMRRASSHEEEEVSQPMKEGRAWSMAEAVEYVSRVREERGGKSNEDLSSEDDGGFWAAMDNERE